MSDYYFDKRFGITAVEMGFITPAQLHEAMMILLAEDLGRMAHRLIGQILLEKAYINSGQIRAVLEEIGLSVPFCLSLQEKRTEAATVTG